MVFELKSDETRTILVPLAKAYRYYNTHGGTEGVMRAETLLQYIHEHFGREAFNRADTAALHAEVHARMDEVSEVYQGVGGKEEIARLRAHGAISEAQINLAEADQQEGEALMKFLSGFDVV